MYYCLHGNVGRYLVHTYLKEYNTSFRFINIKYNDLLFYLNICYYVNTILIFL